MLSDVELEPLDIAEQRNGVGIDVGQVPSCGRRAVELGVDHDLLLREIDDRHVVAVVETFDMIDLDRLVAVADHVAIRERLQGQVAGTCRRKWPGRQPVGLERPRLRRQNDPLVEVSIFVVGDDGCTFRYETTHATQMIG